MARYEQFHENFKTFQGKYSQPKSEENRMGCITELMYNIKLNDKPEAENVSSDNITNRIDEIKRSLYFVPTRTIRTEQ